MKAEFSGSRSVTVPLTWGQLGIWKMIVELAPDETFLNQRRILPVPSRADDSPAAVAKAIGALVSRHESLRTRVTIVDGRTHQAVADQGALDLIIVEAPPGSDDAEVAHDTMERLRHVNFDYAQDWPLRVALITADGRVRQIVLIFSHVCVDWAATEIVVRDLRLLLLRGKIPTPPGLQPADLALREQTPELQEHSQRCREHWLTQYGRIERSLFTKLMPWQTPRYHRALLSSPAVFAATHALAQRFKAGSSSILIAATSLILGSLTRQDTVGMLTIVSNRFQADHRDVITPTNQLGIVVLEPAGDLAAIIPQAWQTTFSSYRFAYYDQLMWDRVMGADGRLHGDLIEPYICFNDMRLVADGDVPPVDLDPGSARSLLKETELTWPESLERFNWHWNLAIHDGPPGSLGLSLTCDTAYVPRDTMAQALRDMEEMLVSTAFGSSS